MNINIEITSSNISSIDRFNIILFNKLNKIKNIKFFILQIINKKKKRKKFTVLKSPHVNKTAREQFETISYTKTIKIYCYQYMLLLFIIKQLKISLVSDVKLKVNLSYNSNKIKKHLKCNLNLNNIILNLTKHKNAYNNLIVTNNYLKFFDSFGEILLKK